MTAPTTTQSERAAELIAEIFMGKPEDPSALYDEAREIGDGVHFFAPASAFLAFRYDDVQTIAVDRNFSSDFVDQWPIARGPQTPEAIRFVDFARRFMAFNDPPRHTALRGIFRKAFMPNAVARWWPTVERAVDELLGRFTEGDEVDFVSQLSVDVPVEAICAVLGIDDLDRPMIRAGTAGLSSAFDPNILLDARLAAIRDALRMADEVDAVIARRRAKPAGDLISLVLESQATDGADAGAADLLTQIVFLLAAGNHTTINMLSNGVLHLLQHPDQRALLSGDPGLVNDFINESLRMEPPIHITPPRLVKEPTVLGETELPAGSLVFQVLAAANRDPRKFDNAGEFRITRRPNRHMTFNHGIHSCVGAPLARLEGEVFFTRFLTRFPDFATGAGPVRLPAGHVQVRGVEILPVRLLSDSTGRDAMRDFSGKVAVITGAADGIGRALAEAFAAAGARLVLADIDGPKVEAVGQDLARLGTEVRTARTDVSDQDQVTALRDAALARFGAVHVVCNNAGVMGPTGDPLWELPAGEWQRVMAVNLWGVLHGIQAFVPAMLREGHAGHIVNTASMQGLTSGPLIPEYTVSKHAIVALSEALRAQLAARSAPIGVTVLCPGAVGTDLAPREQRRLATAGTNQAWAVAPDTRGQQRYGTTLTPAQVAAAAIAAVRNDRFYVFTHPESRNRIEARLRPILDDLDASEKDRN